MNIKNLKKLSANISLIVLTITIILKLVSDLKSSNNQKINEMLWKYFSTILFLYLTCKLVFSLFYNFYWIPYLTNKKTNNPQVGVQIIGTDIQLTTFDRCLQSIRQQTYTNISRIIVVVQKTEKISQQAQAAFLNKFPLGQIMNLNVNYQDLDQSQKWEIQNSIGHNRFIYICQPFKGSRQATFAAFHFHFSTTQFVFHIDSNMILNRQSVQEMVMAIDGHNQYLRQKNKLPSCASVTGQICFQQKQQNNPKISQITRYIQLYEQNVQKPINRFYRTPIQNSQYSFALYKKAIIDQILQEWFFGRQKQIFQLIYEKGHDVIHNIHSSCQFVLQSSEQNKALNIILQKFFTPFFFYTEIKILSKVSSVNENNSSYLYRINPLFIDLTDDYFIQKIQLVIQAINPKFQLSKQQLRSYIRGRIC